MILFMAAVHFILLLQSCWSGLMLNAPTAIIITVDCNCCHIDVWTDDKNITNGLGFRAAAILQTWFSLPLPLPLSPSPLWLPNPPTFWGICVQSSCNFNTIFDTHRGDCGSNDFNLQQGCNLKVSREKGNRNMAKLWWRMYPTDSTFLPCSWPLTTTVLKSGPVQSLEWILIQPDHNWSFSLLKIAKTATGLVATGCMQLPTRCNHGCNWFLLKTNCPHTWGGNLVIYYAKSDPQFVQINRKLILHIWGVLKPLKKCILRPLHLCKLRE